VKKLRRGELRGEGGDKVIRNPAIRSLLPSIVDGDGEQEASKASSIFRVLRGDQDMISLEGGIQGGSGINGSDGGAFSNKSTVDLPPGEEKGPKACQDGTREELSPMFAQVP